jgi:hypothetical protein
MGAHSRNLQSLCVAASDLPCGMRYAMPLPS